jgi:hypothetical protein
MTLGLLAYCALVTIAIAGVQMLRPRRREVLLCRLGDSRRLFPDSEGGADGIKYLHVGDGHARRAIRDKQWIRLTNVRDTQPYMYFRLSGTPTWKLEQAHRLLLGVEYFDDNHPERAGDILQLDVAATHPRFIPVGTQSYNLSDDWRTAFFDITALRDRLGQRDAADADFRLVVSARATQEALLRVVDLAVRRVFVIVLSEEHG